MYFLATLPEGHVAPSPGSKEAEQYLWSFQGTCLELTHNHGTEDDNSFKVNMKLSVYLQSFVESGKRRLYIRSAVATLSHAEDLATLP